jgi:hypothetical protein
MSDDLDTERVLRLLETAIQVSGVSKRRLEEALGVSRGYMTQVLGGKIELKLKLIHRILAEIGLEPLAFFQMAYGSQVKATRPEERTAVEDILRAFQSMGIVPAASANPFSPAPSPALGPEGGNLREMVRQAVREILVEQGQEARPKAKSPGRPVRSRRAP